MTTSRLLQMARCNPKSKRLPICARDAHFTSIEFSDRKVRFYGQTALVTSRAEVNGPTAEGDISGSYRYTRVYVRDEHG